MSVVHVTHKSHTLKTQTFDVDASTLGKLLVGPQAGL